MPLFRRTILRSLLVLSLAVLAVLPAGAQETIRVRVLADYAPTAVTVRAVGAPAEVFLGAFPNAVGRIGAGATTTLTLSEQEIAVRLAEGEVMGLAFRIVPASEGRLEVDVKQGGSLDAPRLYEGALRADVEDGALRLVNTVDLEAYVAAVLPHEYGFDDVEGSKAMAVAIRTYALRSKATDAAPYDHTDDVGSQVYRGLDGVTDTARRAAEATRGEILTYQGAPIDATYFSASGGHTADNDDVWESGPLPYLRGKPDPYDASPHAAWESRVSRADLLRALSDEAGADVTGFFVGDRSRDGRVRSVDLRLASGARQPMTANAFRLLVTRRFGAHALKSTLFDARRDGEVYVFEGKGYGHGVGMSQWGAHEMDRRGHTYRDILAFYYTDVALRSLDGTLRSALDAPVPAPATDPEPPPPVTSGKRIGW